MTAIHHSLPTLELRADPQGVIAGYAATFGGIDSYGDSIAPGAFQESLKRVTPLMLWQHQPDVPIGRWVELGEDGRGLRVQGRLNLRTAPGREAFEHLSQGDINGLSIGFHVRDEEQRDGVRVIKAAELVEISVVSMPADAGARVLDVKRRASPPATLRELEHALQGLGFSRREAAAISSRGFEARDSSDELRTVYDAVRRCTNFFE